MKEAVRVHDLRRAATGEDLESDDGAVRFYAIEALQRLTGERSGTCTTRTKSTVNPHLKKWKDWLAHQPQSGK